MSTLTATIQADVSGFRSAVDKAKKELELFDKSNKNLSKTMKKVNDVTDDQIKTFKKSIDSLQKATSGTKNYRQEASALTSEIQKLRTQYSNLSDTAKKSKFGEVMSASIRQSEARLKSLQKEINNTKLSFSTIAQDVNIGGFNIGSITSQLTKLNPVVVAITGAAKVLGDAFMSSETKMDNFRGTMDGLKSVYGEFLRILNSGEWSKLLNIGSYFGMGKAVYNAEDNLGTTKALDAAYNQKIRSKIASLQERVTAGSVIDDKEIESVRYSVARADMAEYNELTNVLNARNALVQSKIPDNPNLRLLYQDMINAATTGTGRTSSQIFGDIDKAIKELKRDERGVRVQQKSSFYLTSEEIEELARIRSEIKDFEAFKDMEPDIIEVLEAEKQIHELTERTAQTHKLIDRIQKQSAANRKADQDEKIKKEKEYLKVLQQERDEQKKINDFVESALASANKERQQFVNVEGAKPGDIDRSGLKSYDWVAQYKERLEYMQKAINFYSIEAQGINQLASAWSSLGTVIGGTGSIAEKTMSAMANSLTSFTNMFVQLQKIQFQAAQAGALAEGTGNAMKLPFPYSLAAAGTVVATVMSMFANFKSIGSFAGGGMITGANTIGDMNIARVNPGEMILNGSQQKHLFNMLNTNSNIENTSMPYNVKFHIKGQDLIGVFNNYNDKIGRVR